MKNYDYAVGMVMVALIVVASMIINTVAFYRERQWTDMEVEQLKERCTQLEQRARYYDDVMQTYEFFNEHWTATMKGE